MKCKRLTGAVGAIVAYGNHRAVFLADILLVEGAAVVRASGPINDETLKRDSQFGYPTHMLRDFPNSGFWRPDIGVFGVPKDQVRPLSEDQGMDFFL